MKKHFFTFFLLLTFVVFSTAQESEIEKTFTVGGTFNYSHRNSQNPNVTISPSTPNSTDLKSPIEKIRDFNSSLYIGKSVFKNSLAGLIGNYSLRKYKVVGSTAGSSLSLLEYRSQKYGFGIFYRQYFNLNSKFKLYLQPTSLFSKETVDQKFDPSEPSNTNMDMRSFQIDMNVGVQFNIHEKWNLIVQLWDINYEYKYWSESDTDRSTSALNLDFSFRNINLGAEFLF